MSETLLHVTARMRGPARLDDPEIDAPDPSLDALVARAQGLASVVVVGGEPTLRADLPALLGALPAPTLRTDALALASAQTLRDLRAAGMRALRVVLHTARPEAHDWLVGQPGAAKRAMRALLAAAELGIATEIEATLTRPSAPHVAELVVLAEGVRARAVHLVRLAHRGVAAREAIMLVPRFALLEDPLDDAGAAAIRGRIALHVHGFPRCVAPRLGTSMAAPDARAHAFVEDPAWDAIRAAWVVEHGVRCAACPGSPACAGAPSDYLARFGAAEIVSERPRPERERIEVPSVGAPTSVPGRAGRTPVTRLRDIRAIVRRGDVQGDPLIDRPETIPPVLRLSLAPITTSTRVLRARMIRAAQEGATTLRIASGLDHPEAAALLREAAQLPGVEVEVAGDVTPLFGLGDAQIFELKGIARVWAALFDPAQIEPTLALLARMSSIAKIEGRPFVVLRGNEDAAKWNDAFARLGEGAFVRLAGSGSLAALAEVAKNAPDAYRDALLRAREAGAAPAFVDTVEHAAPVADDEPFGASGWTE